MNERQKLQELLKGKIPDLKEKEVWIWGAGNTAELYQEGFKRLEAEGFHIDGYIDKRATEMNHQFRGKSVIPPEQITSRENLCVLICTIRPNIIKEIKQICAEKNIETFLVDEVIFKAHKEDVEKCYDFLYDERSKEVYAELLKARVTGEELKKGICEENQYFYFPPFQKKRDDEVFVDCGAYDGDSVYEYLNKKDGIFEEIIAFEPDEENFEKLKKNIEKECEKRNLPKEKFRLYPFGIDEKDSISKYARYENNEGVGSKLLSEDETSGIECKTVALDSFLTEKYHFLKADIESYEYKMLLGAKSGIKKNKPLLAICIYHNAVDFYSIPLLIKEIVPEYKIAVRHHREDTSETIVYAWIE